MEKSFGAGAPRLKTGSCGDLQLLEGKGAEGEAGGGPGGGIGGGQAEIGEGNGAGDIQGVEQSEGLHIGQDGVGGTGGEGCGQVRAEEVIGHQAE